MTHVPVTDPAHLASRLRNSTHGPTGLWRTNMKRTQNLTFGLTLLTLLVSASVFADSRTRNETTRYSPNNAHFIAVEGRVQEIARDRNRYVVRLNRGGYLLYAPASAIRNLKEGDFVRATGEEVSRGRLEVDRITRVANRAGGIVRNNDVRYGGSLTGVVQSLDFSRRLLTLREDGTGRIVSVDVRGTARDDFRWDNNDGGWHDDIDRWNDRVQNLRRGERVTMNGTWRRDGKFEAASF
jgi:hypothetical protein